MPPSWQLLDRSLFNSILQFAQQKSLNKGKALHAHIIKTTSSSSSSSSFLFLSNSLVNFYAKCGHFQKANLVFDSIPNKDVVSWNSLINAYAQLPPGLAKEGPTFVFDLFKRMRRDNTLPNAHTFSGVFTAVASSLSLDGSTGACLGRQVHALAIKMDGFHDVFVGSSLVNLYCKLGLLTDAQNVFDEMPERNFVSWAAMISGFAFRRMVRETFWLFGSMRLEENGDGVNEFVFTSVLSSLASSDLVDIGKEVHCLLIKNGLLAFVSVVNALVTMYAKCRSLDDSVGLFESSGDRNSITWSAMITGFAQSGGSLKALELFSAMHFRGIAPTEYTFVGFLNACSDVVAPREGKQGHAYLVKLGYGSQMYIMTALVDMYAKCGCTVDARKGFDYLLEPDIVLWTSMIAGYMQNGENEDALVLYGRMRVEAVLPNELTMVSVLKACSCLAALDQGKQIHASVVKYGLGMEVSIGSALSTMYAKCGSLEDGDRVFRRMTERDTKSWNAMISGLSENGSGVEALKLFEEMRLEGIIPDYVTFVSILSACSRMGLVDSAWAYFHMMSHEYGLVPRVEHYSCMVDVLSRAGKLDGAKNLIESAKIDHSMCLWSILLSACRNYRNYELGAYAGEKLMELGSPESSAYVLLSSIYASLGRPKDVERVRSMMKARGVSKEPGCSWIELKSHVHAFVVGDQLHPLTGEICGMIKKLSKQMKDEGYLIQLMRSFDIDVL